MEIIGGFAGPDEGAFNTFQELMCKKALPIS